MTAITPSGKDGYARYEELISRRDALKKEAWQWHRAYVREFGELILAAFKGKIACIRLKKSIEFCQAAVNRGQTPDAAALRAYLEKETAGFDAQLDAMARERASSLAATAITEETLQRVKQVYRALAKKIYPDLNPATEKTPALLGLWHRVAASYQCNDLQGLEELEVLANKALSEQHLAGIDLQIPNLDDKIAALEAEINKIRETDPYQYQYLLADPKLVADKKAELQAELQAHQEYAARLRATLAALQGGSGEGQGDGQGAGQGRGPGPGGDGEGPVPGPGAFGGWQAWQMN